MALVKAIQIATSLTDMTSVGGGRQVTIGSATPGAVVDVYGSSSSSAASRKLVRLTVAPSGGAQVALKGDYSAYMKYVVVSGSLGGSADVFLTGSLRSF